MRDRGSPVVSDTNGNLQMPLVADLLQRDGRRRLEPPVLLRREPLVEALLELVELLEGCTPCDLHHQVLCRFLEQ